MSRGVVNASLAGICAAFAGIAAKFALAPENPPALVGFCDHYIPSQYVKCETLTKSFILMIFERRPNGY